MKYLLILSFILLAGCKVEIYDRGAIELRQYWRNHKLRSACIAGADNARDEVKKLFPNLEKVDKKAFTSLMIQYLDVEHCFEKYKL